MALELPQNMRRFKLRFDFPLECGFVDYIRAPLTPDRVLQLCKEQSVEFNSDLVDKLNARREFYKIRRYYKYSIIRKSPQAEPSVEVRDGMYSCRQPLEGIFNDLLERTRSVLPTEIDPKTILFPPPASGHENALATGKFSILHDTERSLAVVLQDEACNWYIRENEKLRSR